MNSTSIQSHAHASPETRYRSATVAIDRRRIQSDVVEAYRDRVAGYVRRHVSPRHRQEAEQVGLIGLLVALEKFDPSRGVPFWFFAVSWVRKEIQRWMNHGVYWRHHPNGVPNRKVREEHMRPVSMDAPLKGSAKGNEITRHDLIVDDAETIEDLVSTAEELNRLREFLATLGDADRQLLFYEEQNGSNRGKPGSERFKRHQALVERATAFVRGNEADA